MKTNVSIELTDEQRDCLANLIDGKDTKRMATRAEITALVTQHVGGLVASAEAWTFEDVDEADDEGNELGRDIYLVDNRDPLTKTMAKPHDASYVRGWNQVKLAGESK